MKKSRFTEEQIVFALKQASREMCHDHRDDALIYLIKLEADTAP